MTFLVNLYGAPSAGKSTMRAGLFHKLKMAGYNVEEVTEYAKDLSWERRDFALKCQPYVFGKQLRNVERVLTQVEAVITDSPLLLSYFYGMKYTDGKYVKSFYDYVIEQSKSIPSIDYLLERNKPYNPAGRNQTEEQSNEIAVELKTLLDTVGIEYSVPASIDDVFIDVKTRLDKNRAALI